MFSRISPSPRAALAAVAVVVAAAALGGCPPTDVKPGKDVSCSFEEPCATGTVCQDGTCIAPCTGTNACVAGLCDVDSGLCVECIDSSNCPDGKVCNAFANRCVDDAGGCTSDADCGGQICDTIKGSCVECLSDGDCGDGALCDQLTSTCVTQQGCVTDGDCTDGVCSPDSHVCVECFNPAHCASGVCDTATNTCVAGCTDDDASEPNEGGDALGLASGQAHEGSICPGDVDEFLVDVEQGATLNATLTIEGGARLTLVLEGPGGLVIPATPTNDDSIGFSAGDLAAAQYRLVVGGVDAGVTGAYLLSVDVENAVQCTQLDTEPNNTTAAAPTIAADDALHAGSICGNDLDLFKFAAAAGDDVEVAVIPGDGAGTLALSILDGNGNVLASGNPATLSNVSAGNFFARVSAVGGDVTYSVRVNATNVPPVCTQTDAEPNDADAAALSLTPGTASSGTICPGDVDQFRFGATALDDAVVTVTGGGGNVTAKLIRAVDGVQVGVAGTTINAANLDAGGYRVVVQGANASSQSTYSVKVVLTPEPVPDPCLEGGLEPDSAAQGRPLALDGTQLAGRICASDTDFFTFTLPFNSTVTVHARFTHANGDLDIRLKDAGGGQIDLSNGVTNDEQIVHSLAAGVYTVEIFGFNGAVNTYTMEATLQGCTPEDGFEVNNSVAQATPIAPSVVSAARCPGDDDFYSVRIETGDALDATLVGAGLTFSLVSAADGTVAKNDVASGADRRITATGLPAGKYAFRVTGASANRIAYTLTPTITPTPARCVDDGADPNERATDAVALLGAPVGFLDDGSYDVGNLATCDIVDQDWFSVSLPANKLVTVQLGFNTADDVDVEMLEPKGTSGLTRSLARSFATNKQDHVSGIINQAGTYLIMAEGFRSTPELYSMRITVADPPASSCTNDRFDTWSATTSSGADETFRNDDVTTDATVLSTSSLETFNNMRICVGDKDFFELPSVAAGKHIVLHADYTHTTDRDIDLLLFGPGSSTLATQSIGTDGTEDIDFTVVTAGDYFVEVHEFQDNGENFYNFTAKVQ